MILDTVGATTLEQCCSLELIRNGGRVVSVAMPLSDERKKALGLEERSRECLLRCKTRRQAISQDRKASGGRRAQGRGAGGVQTGEGNGGNGISGEQPGQRKGCIKGRMMDY